MRLSSFIVATAATTVVAQNIDETFVIDQSDSFHLLIHARHKPFNKKLLGACHDDTVFETICMSDITSKPPNDMNYLEFQHNTTRYICTETDNTGVGKVIPCSQNPLDFATAPGPLTWWLSVLSPTGQPERVSLGMFLNYRPWSNVAATQISIHDSDYTDVAFDENNMMNIKELQDDKQPRDPNVQDPKRLYRWYLCQTNFNGYVYTALAWMMAGTRPQNPTCHGVMVQRIFLEKKGIA